MSTQVKAAKEALDLAVTEYKRSILLLDRSIKVTPVKERTLNSKVKMVTESLSNLNSSHTSWVAKAGFTEDQLAAETYSTAWLVKEWENVDDIQIRAEEVLVGLRPAPHPDSLKLQICSQKMETLKLDITSKVQNLLAKTASAASINHTTSKLFNDMLGTIKTSLSGEFLAFSKEIMLLDHQNVAARCKEFEEFRRTHQSNIDTIAFQLAEKSSSPAPARGVSNKNIEMEKSKAPSFTGKTIDYPEFKKGWIKVPGECWSDANQVEQIKHKVDAETRRIITRCNTMAEVWEVLDTEYAQEEVINAVDMELRALRLSHCSIPEYIVKKESPSQFGRGIEVCPWIRSSLFSRSCELSLFKV